MAGYELSDWKEHYEYLYQQQYTSTYNLVYSIMVNFKA